MWLSHSICFTHTRRHDVKRHTSIVYTMLIVKMSSASCTTEINNACAHLPYITLLICKSDFHTEIDELVFMVSLYQVMNMYSVQ